MGIITWGKENTNVALHIVNRIKMGITTDVATYHIIDIYRTYKLALLYYKW